MICKFANNLNFNGWPWLPNFQFPIAPIGSSLLSSFFFLLGFTFLLVALSTGAALVYSGCAGSFSTNNLTGHHNIKVIKETDYHVANHVFMEVKLSMLYLRDEF